MLTLQSNICSENANDLPGVHLALKYFIMRYFGGFKQKIEIVVN